MPGMSNDHHYDPADPAVIGAMGRDIQAARVEALRQARDAAEDAYVAAANAPDGADASWAAYDVAAHTLWAVEALLGAAERTLAAYPNPA